MFTAGNKTACKRVRAPEEVSAGVVNENPYLDEAARVRGVLQGGGEGGGGVTMKTVSRWER